MKPRSPKHLPIPRVLGFVLATLALAAGATAVPYGAVAGASPQAAEHRWVGPDLEVVPLTDDEILEFLRSAEIVERETINIGINGIDRLTLEQDGIRLRAGFRQVDRRERDQRVGDEFYLVFRDSYFFEPAAYQLARLLGIPSVPPAVLRRINGVDGSVQVWVEELFDKDDDTRSPDALGWARQLWTMKFFDALIYNVDRNPGNLKVDHHYHLWMIDHTRAFQRKSSPFQPQYANHVSAEVWERLQSLQREDFEAAFSGLLETAEIKFFMDRRAAIIEHINALILERSRDAVIFQ